MYKYIVFDIKNLEPLKLGMTSAQIDSESSKSYIQGITMRGAFIANYIALNKLNDLSAEDKKMLLKGGLEFFNCYPLIKNNRLLPFTKNLFTTKDEMKNFGDTNKLSVKNIKDSKEALQRVKGIEFAKYDFKKKEIKAFNVKKVSQIHIKKEISRDKNNKIFRYEAIKEGNEFKGIIKCRVEYLDKVKDVLERGIFYLGGSKGSGYGKCTVSNITLKDENPEVTYLKEEKLLNEELFNKESSIYLFLTSDLILRNSLGVFLSYPEEEYLKEKLGLENVIYEEAFIDIDTFTSFNNKWKYRLPIIDGVKSGSLIKYRIKGRINIDKLINFIDEGIGERKQEGFGRFIILPNMNFNNITKFESADVNENKKVNLTGEDKEQLKLLSNRIYLNKIRNNIPLNVLNLNNEIKGISKLGQSQVGKVVNLMELIEGMEQNKAIEFIEKYFSNIKNKKNNRELSNRLKSIEIEGLDLETFIKKFIKINKENFYSKYEKPIEIENIKSEINEDEMYKYKISILKEAFRLELKRGDK